MAECLSMVCFRVIGNDTTIAWAASAGQLELNVMMPVIAHTALESLTILTNMSRAFAEFCVTGIEANREHARDLMERSSALSTPLAPYLGYALAADISKQAVRENRDHPRHRHRAGHLLGRRTVDQLLAPHELTEPGVAGGLPLHAEAGPRATKPRHRSGRAPEGRRPQLDPGRLGARNAIRTRFRFWHDGPSRMGRRSRRRHL